MKIKKKITIKKFMEAIKKENTIMNQNQIGYLFNFIYYNFFFCKVI